MTGQECGFYVKRGVELVRGEGTTVWDSKGRSYLDLTSGHGVLNLGHRHPKVVQAMQNQLNRMTICSNAFDNPVRTEYIHRLAQFLPKGLRQVFLCNSGTEAVECSLKMARWITGRTGFVSAMRGFHGRSMGSLSITFNPKYRKPFEPLIEGCSYVPFGNIEALETCITASTAAVILEPIQGEGGVYPAARDYLKRVRQLCDDRGVLLVLDEVQTGFGRTGTLFALEQYGIIPDMLLMAKAMGGGVPIGGVVCRNDFHFKPGLHGNTFGGNPLSSAAALASLEQLTHSGFLDSVRQKSAFLRTELERIECSELLEIRMCGLMIGLQFSTKIHSTLAKLVDSGILALPAGPKVLRLLPPLIISPEEIVQTVDVLQEVLSRPTH